MPDRGQARGLFLCLLGLFLMALLAGTWIRFARDQSSVDTFDSSASGSTRGSVYSPDASVSDGSTTSTVVESSDASTSGTAPTVDVYMCYSHVEPLLRYGSAWTDLSPQCRMHYYGDFDCREFLGKTFGTTHVKVFDFLKDGPIRADFWRVCVLFEFGGLYVDADILPVLPLESYLDVVNDDFMTVASSNGGDVLNPHFIFARERKHPFLRRALESYLHKWATGELYEYWRYSIVFILQEAMVEARPLPPPSTETQEVLVEGRRTRIKYLKEHRFSENYFGDRLVFYNRRGNYINHAFV